MKPNDILIKEINGHIEMMNQLKNDHLCWVEDTANHFYDSLKTGAKILVAGNGGSAADSQHFAAELIGRFTTERRSLPALALTTDSSILTAIANDYGYDHIFSRQIEGLACKGDIFLAISTSGNSENLISAINEARSRGMYTVALLGKTGGAMKGLADTSLIIPSHVTQRIQEAHEWILHAWCALLDARISEE